MRLLKARSRISLPVVRGKRSSYPSRALCPICKRKKVLEPHTMVLLRGGACLQMKPGRPAGPDERMTAFLDIATHTAHDGGAGQRNLGNGWVRIAEDVLGGQFDIAFCSPHYLRMFLTSCVDELEHQMATDRAKLRTKPPRVSRK